MPERCGSLPAPSAMDDLFGLGRITGPSIAVILAEGTGSFSSSFLMAATFAAMAILLTAYLRKPRHTADKEKHR